MKAINKKTKILLDAYKETGLAINKEKTKHNLVFVSCHENAGQNFNK
jgi:hypothetical protein